VGDTEPDKILNLVQHYFGEWEYRELPSKQTFTIPKSDGCVHKHIAREREQNHIYLGHLGITRTNPDFYALFTMDHILGSGAGFTDRISRKLRDEQGLAYTVSANISLSAGIEPGIFAAYIETSPDNMNRAIEGFLEEIRTIRTACVSQEELDLAKSYITGNYVFNFETSNQLACYLINVERYQLGDDFIWNFPQLINCVVVEDIQRVAQQYLDPDNYYIASVGKIQDEL
jgi:zinc protease